MGAIIMRNVDVPTIESPLRGKPAAHWVVLATSVLPAGVLMHMDRHVLVILAPVVQREQQLDTVGITRVLTATSRCYVLIQLPGAWLADPVGPGAAIALCVLALGTSCPSAPRASSTSCSSPGDPFATAWLQVYRALGLVLAPDLCSQTDERTHGWTAIRFVFPLAGILAVTGNAGVLRPDLSKANSTAVQS